MTDGIPFAVFMNMPLRIQRQAGVVMLIQPEATEPIKSPGGQITIPLEQLVLVVNELERHYNDWKKEQEGT